MTLAEVSDRSEWRIETVSASGSRESAYVRNGLSAGRRLKILCRHPFENPLVLECELDNALRLSVPIALAARISVRPHLRTVKTG